MKNLFSTSQESNTANKIEVPRNKLLLRALEPRVLLDASFSESTSNAVDNAILDQQVQDYLDVKSQEAGETDTSAEKADKPANDVADNNDDEVVAPPLVVSEEKKLNEIIFIDAKVDNLGHLLENAPEGVEVIILNRNQDGLEQIAKELKARKDIETIHIMSHGDAGELSLGNATLNSESMMGEHSDELAIIREAMSEDGDILIYGCNFGQGEKGEEAAKKLSQLTDADVAASDDLTGAADKGGDWDLEVKQGNIEAKSLEADEYDDVLGPEITRSTQTIYLNEDSPIENRKVTLTSYWVRNNIFNHSDPGWARPKVAISDAAKNGYASILPISSESGWEKLPTFSYRPNANFYGTDTFTYYVEMGGYAEYVTVTAKVSAVPDAAIITGDSHGSAIEDEVTSISGKLDVKDVDGKAQEEFRKQSNINGEYGQFSIKKDGSWYYNLNTFSDKLQDLKQDERVSEEFTVKSVDGTQQKIKIDVTGRNEDPTIKVWWSAGNNANAFFMEGDLLKAENTLTVEDLDIEDTVDVSVKSVSAGDNKGDLSDTELSAMLTVAPTSILDNTETSDTLTWSFDAGSEKFEHLAKDEILIITYTVEAKDSKGSTGTINITIKISGKNDTPIISIGSNDGITADLVDDGTVKATDTLSVQDIDIKDTVDASVKSVSGAGNVGDFTTAELKALLTVSPARVLDDKTTSNTFSWIFNDSNKKFDYLAKDEVLTLTYTVEVKDSSGATDTQNITIKITGKNDAPTITVGSDDGTTADLKESNTLKAEDTLTVGDVDIKDTVDASVKSVSGAGNKGDLTNAQLKAMLSVAPSAILDNSKTSDTLTWKFDPGSEKFQQLAKDEVLTLTYTVEVKDSNGATATKDIVIKITGENNAPTITVGANDGTSADLVEDATLKAEDTLTVGDVNITNTVTASVKSVTGAGDKGGLTDAQLKAMLSVAPSAILDSSETSDTLTWSFDAGSEKFDYLAKDEVLTLTYTVEVKDSKDATATQNITIKITGKNDAPTITLETGDGTSGDLVEDATLKAEDTLSVADLDIKDTVDASVKSVSGAGDKGKITDAQLKAMLSVSPTAILDNSKTSDTLTWKFDAGSEKFDYLAKDEVLTLTYTVEVKDSKGATATKDVVIKITGKNDAPDITIGDEDGTSADLTEGDPLKAEDTLTINNGDGDSDDAVTASVDGVSVVGNEGDLTNAQLKDMLTVDINDASDKLTWTFDAGSEKFEQLAKNEDLTLTYTIALKDDEGAITKQDIVIKITGENDDPTISVKTGDGTTADLTEGATLKAEDTLTVEDSDVKDTVTASVKSVSAGTGNKGGLTDVQLKAMLSVSPSAILDDTQTSNKLTWTFDAGSEQFAHLAKDEVLSLTYTVELKDNNGGITTKDIVVKITGENDAPTITVGTGDGTSGDVVEDATLKAEDTLSVADLDIKDTVNASVKSVSGAGDKGSLTNAQLKAMLSVSPTAILDNSKTSDTMTWKFDAGSEKFDYLAKDEVLTLTYTVEVKDSKGATATKDVVIKITGKNDAPSITIGDEDGTSADLTEGDPLKAEDTLTINNGDGDSDDAVTASVDGVSVVGNEGDLTNAQLKDMLTVETNDASDKLTWTFDAGSEKFEQLAKNEDLTLTYTIALKDDEGAITKQDIVIKITGENDDPTISVKTGDGTTADLTEGATLKAEDTLTVEDSDVKDTVTASVKSVSAGTGNKGGLTDTQLKAMLSVSPSAILDDTQTSNKLTWTFDAGSEQFAHLAKDEVLSLTYTVELKDNNGGITTKDIVVKITGENDAPTITVGTGDGTSGDVVEDATLKAEDTLSVADLDIKDTVNASVKSVSGAGDKGKITDAQLKAMLSVSPTAILDNSKTSDTLTWKFDAGSEKFDYLAKDEVLTLTYTVEVKDSKGATATKDVVIKITGKNDAPDITIGDEDGTSADLTEGDPLKAEDTLTINNGDGDSDDAVTASVDGVSVVGNEGDLTNAQLKDMLTVDINDASDKLTWTFDAGSEKFEQLAKNEDLTLTYTIALKDDEGAITKQDIVIKITGENDDPTISVKTGDGTTADLTEGATLKAEDTLTVEDSDVKDTVTASVKSVSAGTGNKGGLTDVQLKAMLSVSPSAILDDTQTSNKLTWTFDAGSEQFAHLAKDEVLTLTYTVELKDNNGGITTKDIVVKITGENDAPTITVGTGDGTSGDMVEDATLKAEDTLTVADLDIKDTVEASVKSISAGSGDTGKITDAQLKAMLTVSQTDILDNETTSKALTWKFDAGSEKFDHLAKNEVLTLTYTIEAKDSMGATGTQDVTVKIKGTNDAPSITIGDEDGTTADLTQDEELKAEDTITVTNDDGSIKDTLDLSVDSVSVDGNQDDITNAQLIDMLKVVPTEPSDGNENPDTITWTFDAGDEKFDHLAEDEELTLTYPVKIEDEHGTTNIQEITVTITGKNDAPTITVGTDDGITSDLVEDSTLKASDTVTVEDLDIKDTVEASVKAISAGSGDTGKITDAQLKAMLTVSPTAILDNETTSKALTWSFDAGSEKFDHLAKDEVLTLTYTVEVKDSKGATDTQDITIKITGKNDAPSITIGDEDGTSADLTQDEELKAEDTITVTNDDGSIKDTLDLSVDSVSVDGNQDDITNAQLIDMLKVVPTEPTDGNKNPDTITWTFDAGDEKFDHLAEDEELTLTYPVKIEDEHGTTNIQEITVTITGKNDAPTITVGTDDGTTSDLVEDSTLKASDTVTVEDLDIKDTVEASVKSISAGSGDTGKITDAQLKAMLTVSPTAILDNQTTSKALTWSFDAGSEKFDHLAKDEVLTLTYTVEVKDSKGATDTQEITIKITGKNDAPSITIGDEDGTSADLTQDEELKAEDTITVTNDDGSIKDTLDLSVDSVSVDGNQDDITNAQLIDMLKVVPTEPTDGNENPDTITWTFDAGDEKFDHLAEDEELTLTYPVKIEDEHGTTNIQEITVTITGKNDAPTITVGTDDGTTSDLVEDSTLKASDTVTVEDLDIKDTVEASVKSISAGSGDTGKITDAQLKAMLTVSPTTILDNETTSKALTWSFDAGSEKFDHLAKDEVLTLTYTVEVKDSRGATDTQEITIKITGKNDAPSITISDGDSTNADLNEGEELKTEDTITVTNDDGSIKDTLDLSVDSVSVDGNQDDITNAQLIDMLTIVPTEPTDGNKNPDTVTWTFDAGDEKFDHLAKDEELTLTYTVKIDDEHGTTNTQEITVTITGGNEAPTITIGDNDGAFAALDENGTLEAVDTLTVEDLDIKDKVEASVKSISKDGDVNGLTNAQLEAMLKVSPTDILDEKSTSNTLTWSFDAGDEKFDHLAKDDVLILTYTVEVEDSNGATNIQEITVRITGENDGPILSPSTDTSVTVEGTKVGKIIHVTDPDKGKDNFTFIVNNPARNGTVMIDPRTGKYTYTPNQGYIGSDTFVIHVTDEDGGVLAVPIDVKVVEQSIRVIDLGIKPNITFDALDDDDHKNGEVVISFTQPENGNIVHNENGTFTYTPSSTLNGEDSFTYTVEMADGSSETKVIKFWRELVSSQENQQYVTGSSSTVFSDSIKSEFDSANSSSIRQTLNDLQSLNGYGDLLQYSELDSKNSSAVGYSANALGKSNATGNLPSIAIDDGDNGNDNDTPIKLSPFYRQGVLYVSILDSEKDLDNIKSVEVTVADGSEFPEWINLTQESILIIEPPVGTPDINIQITVQLDGGKTFKRDANIDFATGEITLINNSKNSAGS